MRHRKILRIPSRLVWNLIFLCMPSSLFAEVPLLSTEDRRDLRRLHEQKIQDFENFSPRVQDFILDKIERDRARRPSRSEVLKIVVAFGRLSQAEKQALYRKAQDKRARILNAESDEEQMRLIESVEGFEKQIPPPPPRPFLADL